jgi:hypothetical protein
VVVNHEEGQIARGVLGRVGPNRRRTAGAGNHVGAELSRQHGKYIIIREGGVRGGVDETVIGGASVFGGPKVGADPAVLGRFHDPLRHEHGVDVLVDLDARAQTGIVLGHEIFDLAQVGTSQVRSDKVVQGGGLSRHLVKVVDHA